MPAIDQHASHERNSRGNYICDRLGAACDFLVEDEHMHEVAKWIHKNTLYDRIYYYGPQRPLHVSVGPTGRKVTFEMVRLVGGRLVPHKLFRQL